MAGDNAITRSGEIAGPSARQEEERLRRGNELDVDAAVEGVLGDVVLDPLPGPVVVGDGGEHVVGDGDHGLDARPGEALHGALVGVEDLHLPEAVVREQARYHLGREPARGHGAPVHP